MKKNYKYHWSETLSISLLQFIFVFAPCLPVQCGPAGTSAHVLMNLCLFVCFFNEKTSFRCLSVQSYKTSNIKHVEILDIIFSLRLLNRFQYPESLPFPSWFSVLALTECPHESFVENNICDSCRGWKEVTMKNY